VTTVDIISNPASGKDIRRFVAFGSVFDNQERVRIMRRRLLGLAAMGGGQSLLYARLFRDRASRPGSDSDPDDGLPRRIPGPGGSRTTRPGRLESWRGSGPAASISVALVCEVPGFGIAVLSPDQRRLLTGGDTPGSAREVSRD
jgi:hypothetical protein